MREPEEKKHGVCVWGGETRLDEEYSDCSARRYSVQPCIKCTRLGRGIARKTQGKENLYFSAGVLINVFCNLSLAAL